MNIIRVWEDIYRICTQFHLWGIVCDFSGRAGECAMVEDEGLNGWHALFVVTGQEDNVRERLVYRFGDRYRILIPKRKLRERKNGVWSDIVRILFPGYLLIRGEVSREDYHRFRGIPGLLRFLGDCPEYSEIDAQEMLLLSRMTCNDEIIGYSEVLVENGRVRVIDGPLLSLEGIINKIDPRKGRAKVCLNFLGEERLVDLGIRMLQPV